VTWIAEERIVFVDRGGRRTSGRIAIGMPRIEDDHARCAVALEPLLPGTRSTHSESTLQALVMALRLVGSQIDTFLKSGGRILCPDTGEPGDTEDVDFAIEAVLGPLLAP
jgi:hypothetical protein